MIYLNKKMMLPASILISIALCPSMIALFLLIILSRKFELAMLIILLLLVVVYTFTIKLLFKISNSKRNFLIAHEDGLEIHHENVNQQAGKLFVKYDDIEYMDYYRISSIKSWFVLYSYVVPRCVYITYSQNGESATEFIGYMDYKEIQTLTKNKGIKLVLW